MSFGLEIKDTAGNVVLGITDRITRELGRTTISADGSVTDARFADGTPWWINPPAVSAGNPSPDFTLIGTTLYWTFPGGSGGSFHLIYGIY